MKINFKITLYLILYLIVFFISFNILWLNNKNSLEKIRENSVQEYKRSFTSILKLIDKPYQSILYNMTQWDEMVSFIYQPDTAWADDNVRGSMESVDFEYIGILNGSKKVLYYSQKYENSDSLLNKLNTLELDMDNPTFYNYYIKHEKKIIQLFIGPIQPSWDIKRKSIPEGYMIIGKEISKAYIDNLKLITKQNITFRNEMSSTSYDFIYPLFNQNKKIVNSILVYIDSNTINVIDNIFKNQLIILLIASIILIVSLIILIYNLLINPLKVLTDVIAKRVLTNDFKMFLKRKDEIGLIAKSIKNHFEQVHLLEEYKHAVDISSIVSKTDINGVITYVNDKFCDISGYTEKELIGNTHSLLRHPAMDDTVFKDLWKTIKKDKKPWFGIIKNKAKDGSSYYVNSVINPILNFNGDLVEYIAIRNDITKIEKSKNKLERQFEQIHLLEEYKHAVDISSIVSKTDINGVITYVNDKFCDISGYTEKELIGNTHALLRHPDMDDEIFKDLWKTIKKDKKPWFGKIKNKVKNGNSYYLDSVINPIFDSNGDLIEFIAIRTDITKAEESKNDLKEQYSIASDRYDDIQYLSKSYENAIEESNIILRVDLDRNITYANEMFCEISGYELSELIGKPYSILKHPDVQEEDIEKLWSIIESGETWKGNLKNLSKNGDTYYSLATIVPIKNKDGGIIEYIGIRKDITEVVTLHTEIEETQRELIYKLGEIGESRSKETGNHVKRVAEYSKLLALLYGLSKEEAELLKYASPMHDIGKIGIPDSILNKPGKLTIEEFEVMKTHSSIGYEMLKGSHRPILQTSAIVSNEHHEKWDGSGYPRGLKGDDIHIYGRITAIADVFDALASERPYKKSWELEKILNLFKEQKGKHFDPKLIELFFDNIDKFLNIRNRFS